VDTHVSEEHTALIFRVEVCRFSNRLVYLKKLLGGIMKLEESTSTLKKEA
jgi:hypothetical protein